MRAVNERKEGVVPEFVRDIEGAQLARMSVNTFRKLAEEFGAVRRIGRTRLTDWAIFKEGLKENYGNEK